jgi:hypothetical protein
MQRLRGPVFAVAHEFRQHTTWRRMATAAPIVIPKNQRNDYKYRKAARMIPALSFTDGPAAFNPVRGLVNGVDPE